MITLRHRRIRPWRTTIAAVGLFAFSLLCGDARATLIGPNLNYLSFLDSPFSGLSFQGGYFELETFESGHLHAPAVTASAGSVIGPGPLVDSVDGHGPNGRSFFSACGACGITFTFGNCGCRLPTEAGIVWTDGDGPSRTFKAFDQFGKSLGTIIDSSPLFFSTGGDGDFHNYRFFGVANPGGISSIFIANDGGGIEVDHLQFGFGPSRALPELSTWAMMIVGFGLTAWRLHSRNRARYTTA